MFPKINSNWQFLWTVWLSKQRKCTESGRNWPLTGWSFACLWWCSQPAWGRCQGVGVSVTVWVLETCLPLPPMAVLPTLCVQQRGWVNGSMKKKKEETHSHHSQSLGSENAQNLLPVMSSPNKKHRGSCGSTLPTPGTHIQTPRQTPRKKMHGKNSAGKKKSFLYPAFQRFHLVPEVYGWPWYLSWLSTSTDWPLKPFPVSYRNSEWLECTAQLVQYSGQPRCQGTCAASFSDKRCISVFLWTQFWLSYS